MQVLIVEDERNISSLVRSTLEEEGFACSIAHDGEDGLRQFQEQQPDVVLLDLRLPKMDGIEVCNRIRQSKSVRKDPYVIMLTAKGAEIDRIVGYSTGADDYIAKPFSPQELIARLRAVLRRMMRHQEEQRTIGTPHFVIDLEKREVMVQKTEDGEIEAVTLTTVEFDLLAQMASRPKRVWTRSELLDAVRGNDFIGDDRAIDTYIRRLRNKISPSEQRNRFIRTHFSLGYSFEDD
jgi:DNA-binding response OmpR family regulator